MKYFCFVVLSLLSANSFGMGKRHFREYQKELAYVPTCPNADEKPIVLTPQRLSRVPRNQRASMKVYLWRDLSVQVVANHRYTDPQVQADGTVTYHDYGAPYQDVIPSKTAGTVTFAKFDYSETYMDITFINEASDGNMKEWKLRAFPEPVIIYVKPDTIWVLPEYVTVPEKIYPEASQAAPYQTTKVIPAPDSKHYHVTGFVAEKFYYCVKSSIN